MQQIEQQSVPDDWHASDSAEVVRQLATNADTGLSSVEAAQRLEQHGPNELAEQPMTSPLKVLWEQITDPLVLLLLFAAGISALLGKADSVIAIMAIVALNAVLGVLQERRAERAMAALKQMAAPLVRVRRDGIVKETSARELVPGDVVLLEAGSVVPADARLLIAANLSVQEASLTGESLPVEKLAFTLSNLDVPLGDRRNMVYMGTEVTFGRGEAVLVMTGMRT